MLILLPLLGIFGNGFVAEVEANLSLGFKAIKLPRHPNPANCSVGNTTFAHGVTFKLDCKTQCVCENGRHACSTLCPNEQLPAPEDTISCRSPRLVEVPGHCCKMWLCENPTADVYATCHNSTTSGNWTACSRTCGLGTATRHTTTHAGCHQLSNLRLCQNRRCDKDDHEDNKWSSSRPLTHKRKQHRVHSHSHQHYHHHKEHEKREEHEEPAHRIRKGHECRSIQRLGPARIRLGECVSRKLYRPKLCGRCHRGVKCCAPSVSTTIQVELLCPLNAVDPINYVQRRQPNKKRQLKEPQDDEDDDDDGDEDVDVEHEPLLQSAQLWDTVALEPIDQEFLQSHQIQIENKFIAVEWILKCECSTKNCNADSSNISSSINSNSNDNMANTNKHGYYNYKNNNRGRNHETNGEPNEPTNNNAGNNKDNEEDVVDSGNHSDHNDVDNMSSEQQPDIIPYPLSVGESSWKAEKLRRQQHWLQNT
ncbi:basic-leucine zipper transcription factor A [Drosophila yakuba]|uniref:Uncharacterized protein, isoform A n=1 Tax=Drosophila yakuba TaxID=7245 RepID=B4PJK0_DROYA|nr:basic-leucine zipper transcription factor A [Drosophila yakuba]XP_015050550.1 basic-leucine zipper transcription factor A [Drosophila yakuba]EDW94688.1 uncharacterized protein Dyak_GE19926, isoform A [Drosophila yakuba]KRK01987.1 uncharacterized protein Dyak_GE19926, isoform B [Drosophila yakuba]KRK01988.1 uncharacterized protein Dyak_GE19926, isoform C [Drosophila yakuba]KRK01989.1 uncharacterized protein Dyak_GE19926, isoform D [Drosophila yakuba]